MRTVCLINSFNYEQYINECIQSAIGQTHPFDAIHVIDDGSTDDSRALIQALASRHDNLLYHFKENGGQLSCFNTAAEFVRAGDLVCMLDADDVLPPDYLTLLLTKHQNIQADLYFCEPTYFKTGEPKPESARRITQEPDFNWPISSHWTRAHRNWTGSPTSCLSVTGTLYRKLLPLDLEQDWRTRADDVLIFGAAISGASKCHLPSLTVGYRVHGTNHYYGRPIDPAATLRHELLVERLFTVYCDRFKLNQRSPLLANAEKRELSMVPASLRQRFNLPTDKELALERYRGLRRSIKKLRMMLNGE